MSLRDRLRALQKIAREKHGIGEPESLPMLVVCRGIHPTDGAERETRKPGVYWVENGHGGTFPEIVFRPAERGSDSDPEPDLDRLRKELRKELKAGEEWDPLWIIGGPLHVAPPADLPRD